MLLASLVEPSFGLIFWMTLSFLVVLYILAKFAWRPILTGLKEREVSIANSLDEARKAREEMVALNARNEDLMREAREEREVLLKDARDIRDKEIAASKIKAKADAEAMLTRARAEIRNEKSAAMTEIKVLVGELSVEIAEKILRERLSGDPAQRALLDRMLKDAEARLS